MPKPRFTLRQLIVVTALVCLYLGLWKQTHSQGLRAFEAEFGRPCYGSPMPFLLTAVDPRPPFDDTGPLQIGSLVIPPENRTAIGIRESRPFPLVTTFRYYVWAFGHIYRTPLKYECPIQRIVIEDDEPKLFIFPPSR